MKAIRIFLFILIIIGIGLLCTQKFWVPKVVNWILEHESKPAAAPATGDQRFPSPAPSEEKPEASLKTETFSGKLEEVNVGCFVDGECYVVVDKKHVTVVMGWSQETVGSIIGVPSIGDLEEHKGEVLEVYAQKKEDGSYTLYGSKNFYVKLKK